MALTALALTVRREWLDRPRLTLTADMSTTPDGRAKLFVIAENIGRQPTTVGQVGIEWDFEPDVLSSRTKGTTLFNDPWSRQRVEAGGNVALEWEVPARPAIHVDTPVRVFARYAGRRTRWGKPQPLFRSLMNLGWAPDPTTPPELLEAPAESLIARPVEPAWKLWRPAVERRTSAPSDPLSSSAVVEARRGVKEIESRG